MPIAVLAFDFDPSLRLGETAVRLETLAVAAAIFAAIVVAAIGTRAMELRADDMLFVVLGIVPGAVVGGRIGYVLLHAEFFAASPAAILDPAVGSLELTLAVCGGALTGTLVAALVDGRAGRWLHIAIMPVLLALGAGKLAMVLGGTGQGVPWDGQWATAFVGPGPWGSLAPAVPSHPAQVYEALGTFAVLAAVMGLLAIPGLRRPDGRAFLIGLAMWAGVRAAVASTWRDAAVVGPLRAEQAIDIAVAVVCLLAAIGVVVRERRTATPEGLGYSEADPQPDTTERTIDTMRGQS